MASTGLVYEYGHFYLSSYKSNKLLLPKQQNKSNCHRRLQVTDIGRDSDYRGYYTSVIFILKETLNSKLKGDPHLASVAMLLPCKNIISSA